jgi:hypothetical protein
VVCQRGLWRVGDWRYPGVAGEGVADGGQGAEAVLAGGVGVAADRVPVPGAARSGAGRRSSAVFSRV